MYIICKLANTQPYGLHYTVPILLHSWNEIAIGFVEFSRIRMCKDFNFMIMNMFSKLFHFLSFHKTRNNLHHAYLIFEGIIHLHSVLTIKLDLVNAFYKFETSLSNFVFTNEFVSCLTVSEFGKIFQLFRTKFVWYKTFAKTKLLLKTVLCACKWLSELRKHVNSVLNVFCHERLFEFHDKLFNNSCHTFDVFSLVLLRSLKKQDQLQKIASKHKARTIQFGFRNWKYLRKPGLKPRSDDTSQVFIKINNKDHPTDLQGKYNERKSFNVTDLVPFIADESDLRSNLSEEGGDDTSMDGAVMESFGSKDVDKLEPEEGAKEQLEPEELQGALELPVGAITRLRAKKLKQAVSTLLRQAESNLSNRAYPTTLVVIQAN